MMLVTEKEQSRSKIQEEQPALRMISVMMIFIVSMNALQL